jgi:hypothetical protein
LARALRTTLQNNQKGDNSNGKHDARQRLPRLMHNGLLFAAKNHNLPMIEMVRLEFRGQSG